MLLKIGSKGEDVKKLQEKLGLGADGVFGPGTEKAVKKWQIDHDLAADGLVGEGTWSKMFPTQQVITEPAPVAPVVSTSIPSNSGFKLEKLKGHIPDSVIAQIPETAKKFNITNSLRLAHFLAQCGHESGGFKATQENLNYSAKGLAGTFRKYFINEAAAGPYAKNPQKIASKVYGGRMGNGPESTGEGYKFRGRGYIQLTGKDNYTNFAKFIGEDTVANPDLVATKYPLASAAFFFDSNKLWSICDKGADVATVTAVTKRVNGGTIGLPDRIKHFQEYYHLLS
jgi:putative chitinase